MRVLHSTGAFKRGIHVSYAYASMELATYNMRNGELQVRVPLLFTSSWLPGLAPRLQCN